VLGKLGAWWAWSVVLGGLRPVLGLWGPRDWVGTQAVGVILSRGLFVCVWSLRGLCRGAWAAWSSIGLEYGAWWTEGRLEA
jgi:hypothetical protein